MLAIDATAGQVIASLRTRDQALPAAAGSSGLSST
jgi:hypothetical protein